VPNERINGDGHWAALGTDPKTGQPITTSEWIDRLAPKAAIVLAMGTCATFGGIPAMRNNPTGAMGLRDHLGRGWRSRVGHPIVNLPGCPVQPDNITETLLYLVLQLAGTTAPIDLDDQGRPAWLFRRTVHEVCNRAGFADHNDYADGLGGGDTRCLVKFGCKGPVVKCNVPARGWINGIGGCPNVGGICMACTMPGFPDKYMPLFDTGVKGKVIAAASRFAYGPVVKQLRNQSIKRRYDIEPEWRRPAATLASGYQPRW
jgi:hydrogenase small subunit